MVNEIGPVGLQFSERVRPVSGGHPSGHGSGASVKDMKHSLSIHGCFSAHCPKRSRLPMVFGQRRHATGLGGLSPLVKHEQQPSPRPEIS